LGGGWPRGRVCSLRTEGAGSAGRTSLAVLTVSSASRRGLLCAWIDGAASLDPVSLKSAAADTNRVLWVRGPMSFGKTMSAGEEVIRTGGFDVVVIRPPGRFRHWKRSHGGAGSRTAAWMRLSRAVERGRVVLLALDDEDGSAIPGCLTIMVGGYRVHWAGTPGVSDLLLGVGTRVATADGNAALELVSAEMI
ncbi:MAG: hypothetical protein GXP54_13420, partial [Deltaproteobacteria bacterium]|nr:hypothetical protein [Deltaproteobacteria bacterium]